jgi:DinB family protein
MKTVEFIRMALESQGGAMLAKVDDMKDQPVMFPTPKGGNHPLWVLGHLAWSDGQLLEIMTGRANPLGKWRPVFGFGSEPTGNAADYPSFAECRKAFEQARAETIKVLSSLSDADLDRASEKCPPEAKEFVGTYGKCFLVMIQNAMGHDGQLADARRAAGRKRLRM